MIAPSSLSFVLVPAALRYLDDAVEAVHAAPLRSRRSARGGSRPHAGAKRQRLGRGHQRLSRGYRASLIARSETYQEPGPRGLIRNLKGKPPVTDVFGRKGRRWLAELDLPEDERHTVDGCLREVDFVSEEIATLDWP